MNCMNCGTRLTDMDLDYCPRCGCNVLIQKKVEYLSKLYYNQGLEKASIRDLSGAISCLKQSLAYDKRNIRARNLLGLVYFENGEVVAALSEWIISKNIQKNRNLASEYIERLQANQNKLETINESIKKYNNALAMCREGHEDMAGIRLKKILAQNPKLIKGYHLLALIQMKNQEWNKARKTLKKAARIDKTNTTTLRFVREIDEQDVYRQANEQIVQYSESLSSQGVALSKAQGEAEQSSSTADATAKQVEEEKKRSQSYEALFSAYTAMQQEDLDTAAVEIQKVYTDTLSDSAKGIYNTICEKTGVSGITGDSAGSDSTASADSSDGSAASDGMSDGGDGTSDGTDQSSYDESGDASYDSSYSDGYTEE